ncbi:hypothetical protein LshimejAT787_0501080 [Lyophyllum shimeji]|uniref:Uncharacterized protein n=1 Tax=Lyophyllum shimeji TaxID=47721 RepID=A0A9P3UM26_LYOSH|nr:hypothetical protein LshimejAT787_0501080 [Lyophyllum shimeji]
MIDDRERPASDVLGGSSEVGCPCRTVDSAELNRRSSTKTYGRGRPDESSIWHYYVQIAKCPVCWGGLS